MPRFERIPLQTSYDAISALNTNLTRIEELFERVVFRDETNNNELTSPVNANHNKIQNLGAPTVPSDAARLQDVLNLGGGGTVNVTEVKGINAVSITDYDVEGETTSDAALQKALDTGKAVYLPAGQGPGASGHYILGEDGQNIVPTNTGNLDRNDIHIFGDGKQKTIITQDPLKQFLFYANPVGTGTAAVPNVQQDVYKRLYIHDLTLRSDVATLGFAEFRALISLSAYTDVIIERVHFEGWQGDALQLIAGDIGGGGQNRYNKNVVIRDCTFDGVNKNNRMAITLISFENVTVDNCFFTRCTRPGGVGAHDNFDINTGVSMPGVIDIEPNGFTSNVICKGLYVTNCRFVDNGTAAMVYYVLANGLKNIVSDPDGTLGLTWGSDQRDYFFVNNIVESCGRIASMSGTVSDAQGFQTVPTNIVFADNICNNNTFGIRCFSMDGMKIINNTFYNNGHHHIGFDQAAPGKKFYNRNIDISGNTFNLDGNDGVGGLRIYNGSLITIKKNKFIDCSGTAIGILSTGRIEKTVIKENEFHQTLGATKNMPNSIIRFTFVGEPDIDEATVVFDETNTGTVPSFDVVVDGAEVRSPPTTGRWERGNYLRATTYVKGEPLRFICVNPNADPTLASEWVATLVPGGRPDDDITPAWTGTLTAGMAHDGNGRYTTTAPGFQYFKSTTAYDLVTAGAGVRIDWNAPWSSTQQLYIGVSSAATFDDVTDMPWSIEFDNGIIRSKIDGAYYSDHGTFSNMDKGRIVLQAGVLTIYKHDGTSYVQQGLTIPVTGTRNVYIVGNSVPINTSIQITHLGAV